MKPWHILSLPSGARKDAARDQVDLIRGGGGSSVVDCWDGSVQPSSRVTGRGSWKQSLEEWTGQSVPGMTSAGYRKQKIAYESVKQKVQSQLPEKAGPIFCA